MEGTPRTGCVGSDTRACRRAISRRAAAEGSSASKAAAAVAAPPALACPSQQWRHGGRGGALPCVPRICCRRRGALHCPPLITRSHRLLSTASFRARRTRPQVNLVMQAVDVPDSIKGLVTGFVFTTLTLPVTNYRFCKSMDMKVDLEALFKVRARRWRRCAVQRRNRSDESQQRQEDRRFGAWRGARCARAVRGDERLEGRRVVACCPRSTRQCFCSIGRVLSRAHHASLLMAALLRSPAYPPPPPPPPPDAPHPAPLLPTT